MYIEHHQEDWGGGCSIFNNDEDFDPVGIGFWYYAAGKEKPHYPLPVIPLEVDICSAFVAVCEMNNPQYKYGLITLYPHN